MEWYRKVKFAGQRKGERADTELVHTVNGEIIPIRADNIKWPVPELDVWPFLNEYDIVQTVPSREEIDFMLKSLWSEVTCFAIRDVTQTSTGACS